jgi:CheY-like chemotaxis protein
VITIATGILEADEDYLGGTVAGAEIPTGEYVYVEVSDNGCGMEHATLARMFEPFFSTKFAGRGLGLAAVDGIVRGHNGTIKVVSDPQQGTAIRVLLPVVSAIQKPDATAAESQQSHLRGSILVADGEETTSYLARRILQRAGYRTMTATDLDEMLAILQDHKGRVDLVLIDSYLPIAGGGELKSRIKNLPQRPAFIMTGDDPEEYDSTGSCCSCFVHKPYRPQELIAAVERALAESQKQQSSYSI